MDSLRWILLIVGLLVVVGVFLYGWLQERRRRRGAGKGRRSRSDEELAEPSFDAALEELDSLIVEERQEPRADEVAVPPEPVSIAEPPPAQPAPEPEVRPVAEPKKRTARPAEPEAAAQDAQGPGEKIVIINVMAADGRRFNGAALVAVLEEAELQYGEHGIYHRMLNTRSGPVALYSVANIVEPGSFDLERLDELSSPGVAMFMQLPGPFDGLAAFDQMLETARRIGDRLGGQLLDARRCDLTRQAIEHIREDLREYRRLAHLAARKAR